MKRISLIPTLILFFVLFFPAVELPAQKIPAFVPTEWLEDNLETPDIYILDVRDSASYASGHIPGSVNIPAYPHWFVNLLDDSFPWMELPEKDVLLATLNKAGIDPGSLVVVIGQASGVSPMEPAEFNLTKAARVALTLIYSGVSEITLLNGGYDKWAAEGRIISVEPAVPDPERYTGTFNESIFVSRDYVEKKLGKSVLIDTRSTDVYFGVSPDYSSRKAGHIPTARNLPAPWFWTDAKVEEGETPYLLWKDPEEVTEIALAVLGDNMSAEIIDYCGVGGYASPVWYVLTRVVGYTNVKFYDGSMQEWTTDPEAPVVRYRCE